MLRSASVLITENSGISRVLANDPRPRYQKDPERVYAMDFAGMEIKFSVSGEKLLVREIIQT